ncbi:MAG: Fe(3+) ABC transporter substrate-binding protein [Gomphosphaeria aponina SAG 52.96 = DSM 107014]|uniref:Fe(3+) ABC transporter substrate-binding protein n=1 Tax=Gomphosphaeria aponina SAG 52.96 = DSM 107014 TaxID=1521640 RepID=A0A941GWT9_9CHRO|nr:Fe(3+) ABC transporter substrate-binding protein [Gomphosphaeria aponina SAG 52.96 = DSM 107014]
MTKISRRIFLGGLATSTFVATQLGGRVTKAQTGEINLYSSRHYNTDQQLYQGFEEQTGIKVNLVEGEADALIERINSEGANSPADILITVDAGRLWRADEAGIFTPISSAVLSEKIPANLRHPEGHWFGFSKRARVIMYHKNRVDPAQLSTYEDLADPKWNGMIAIRSSTNIYNQSMVGSLVEIHGEEATEEWCRGLVANFARSPEGGDRDQIDAVAAGLADMAIANTYYLAAYAQENDPAKQAIFDQLGVFFPNQEDRGTHVNISGAGVVKTAPNPEAAVKFLEYLANPTAQAFFAQGNNEYPVVEGVPIDPVVQSFGFPFKEDLTSVATFGPNIATAVQVMDRAGWK